MPTERFHRLLFNSFKGQNIEPLFNQLLVCRYKYVDILFSGNPEAIEIQGSWTKQGVRYLNVTHGKSVTVDCETSGAGKLPSSYAWRLGNQDITRTSFQKSLTYIFNKSDNGKSLRCITGSAVEGSVRLNVHCKLSVYAETLPV